MEFPVSGYKRQITIALCPKCGANLFPDNREVLHLCDYCGNSIILKYSDEPESQPGSDNTGYVLYWDQERVCHESGWNRQQSQGNLYWNILQYPYIAVRGMYDGEILKLPATLFRFKLAPEISVLPCFVVPLGEKPPGNKQMERLNKHLEWAQSRYSELFNGQSTFTISSEPPKIYFSTHDLAFYRNLNKKEANYIAGEILTFMDHNRYTCPYICFCVVQNEGDDFPVSCGQPFNGGFNTGGGIALVSSYALNRQANFQSTVQHELAHAFGLPHVSAYGYDMDRSPSILSYNRDHNTRDFQAAPQPGIFIPEDRRGLALNHRVFTGLDFDVVRDVPPGYRLYPDVYPNPRMEIPGQPQGIQVRTISGEAFSSKVTNIVQKVIRPSKAGGSTGYDQASMWHSEQTRTGWVMLEVIFPFPVEITSIRVHTQHSGVQHAAQSVRISTMGEKGVYQLRGEIRLRSIDERVGFPLTRTRGLKLDLKAGPSGYVVVRGLQFYSSAEEIFPPLLPCD